LKVKTTVQIIPASSKDGIEIDTDGKTILLITIFSNKKFIEIVYKRSYMAKYEEIYERQNNKGFNT
jgi:hypothetical protein